MHCQILLESVYLYYKLSVFCVKRLYQITFRTQDPAYNVPNRGVPRSFLLPSHPAVPVLHENTGVQRWQQTGLGVISKGQGLIVIPENHIPEFKRLLVAYYENRDNSEIVAFMRSKCWRTF